MMHSILHCQARRQTTNKNNARMVSIDIQCHSQTRRMKDQMNHMMETRIVTETTTVLQYQVGRVRVCVFW